MSSSVGGSAEISTTAEWTNTQGHSSDLGKEQEAEQSIEQPVDSDEQE